MSTFSPAACNIRSRRALNRVVQRDSRRGVNEAAKSVLFPSLDDARGCDNLGIRYYSRSTFDIWATEGQKRKRFIQAGCSVTALTFRLCKGTLYQKFGSLVFSLQYQ